MKIHNEIISMIEKAGYISKPVSAVSNLYTDLGFDSLTFITFLIKVEEKFLITFDIAEMGQCFCVDNLIALVESKVAERDSC